MYKAEKQDRMYLNVFVFILEYLVKLCSLKLYKHTYSTLQKILKFAWSGFTRKDQPTNPAGFIEFMALVPTAQKLLSFHHPSTPSSSLYL